MIFVTLGTQDKPYKRLLDYLEHSNITDRIVVQAGYTKYESSKLEIYEYLDKEAFDKYLREADYIVCHSGVGTIVEGLKLHKKILAVPRLSKYGEHHNDHQVQIAEAYYQKGYILKMLDTDNFDEKFNELKTFKPVEFVSNNEVFVNKLKEYIML